MNEVFMAYQPMQTTMTSTTWSGWSIVNPKCYGCWHCTIMYGKPVCHCASRVTSSDGACLSYSGGDAE